MSDQVEEIRSRLSSIPYQPWKYSTIESIGGGTIYDRDVAIAHVEWDTERVDGHIRRTRTEDEADRVGRFIAQAPSDIAYLLGLVRRLKAEIMRITEVDGDE